MNILVGIVWVAATAWWGLQIAAIGGDCSQDCAGSDRISLNVLVFLAPPAVFLVGVGILALRFRLAQILGAIVGGVAVIFPFAWVVGGQINSGLSTTGLGEVMNRSAIAVLISTPGSFWLAAGCARRLRTRVPSAHSPG